MRRMLMTAALLLGSVAMAAPGARAQSSSSESKTKVKTEHAETVTYTGCVRNGTEARTFVLQNVGNSTYVLVPEQVELQEHVGHKVEISGVLIPAGHGDSKVTTRTEVNGKEDKTKTEVERGAMPQVKVLSVRPLGESCS